MPKISQIDEVPCQAEVRILQKITLKSSFLSLRVTLVLSFDDVVLSKGAFLDHKIDIFL